MKALLKKLDAWLKANRPDYYENLQQPWTDEQFAVIQQLAGTELPKSFRALYGWKGGQSALAGESLYDSWRFLQFEEARIEYKTYNELHEMGEFKVPNWWSPQWVPFLTNEEGALMCVDLGGAFDGKPGQLVTFVMEEPSRSIEFPSLEEFLTSLLEGYEEAEKAGTLSEPIQIPYPKGYPIEKRAA